MRFCKSSRAQIHQWTHFYYPAGYIAGCPVDKKVCIRIFVLENYFDSFNFNYIFLDHWWRTLFAGIYVNIRIEYYKIIIQNTYFPKHSTTLKDGDRSQKPKTAQTVNGLMNGRMRYGQI